MADVRGVRAVRRYVQTHAGHGQHPTRGLRSEPVEPVVLGFGHRVLRLPRDGQGRKKEERAPDRRDRHIRERNEPAGAQAAQARNDLLVHAPCRKDAERQVQGVEEAASQVAGRIGQVENRGQEKKPGQQEQVFAAASANRPWQARHGKEKLRRERQQQADRFGRHGIL